MTEYKELHPKKYRDLFIKRAKGDLEPMHCTRTLHKLVQSVIKGKTTFLDIGCGVGHYYRCLLPLNIVYKGIDIDPEKIKIAKKLFPNIPFEVGDITHIDEKDNSYDIVICYNLLLHLKDWLTPLKELLRVSKKYIFIRTLISNNGKQKMHEDAPYNIISRDAICNVIQVYSPKPIKIGFVIDVVPSYRNEDAYYKSVSETPQGYEVIMIEKM